MGCGRDPVIACNRGDADAAGVAFLDGFGSLLARRIKQPRQAQHKQIDRTVLRTEISGLFSIHSNASTRSPCEASLSDSFRNRSRSSGTACPL